MAERLTYEQALQALQGMLGELVSVNVGPADDGVLPIGAGLTAGFWGVLRRAEPVGYETREETFSFHVLLPGVAGVGGVFVVGEEFYESAQWNDLVRGMLVIYASGMRIAITPKPRLALADAPPADL